MFPITHLYPEIELVLTVSSFILGCCMGSFFNVCIYRIPLNQPVGRPKRSYCFSCGSMVEGRDNIPLLSYLLLRGACRHCGSHFSSRYFWVELLTGLLFLAAYREYGATVSQLAYFTFIGLMLIATFTDIDNWIIPDRISIGGFFAGVAFAVVLPFFDPTYVLLPEKGQELNSFVNAFAYLLQAAPVVSRGVTAYLAEPHAWKPLADAICGGAFGYGMLMFIRVLGQLLFRREAMGMGDLKLFACIGAFLGWLGALYVLMAACILGSVIGGAQMLFFKLTAPRAPAPPEPATESAAEAGSEESAKAAEDGASTDVAEKPPKALHPLPFGPYIAVAAVLVLLGYRYIPAVFNYLSHLSDGFFEKLYGA